MSTGESIVSCLIVLLLLGIVTFAYASNPADEVIVVQSTDTAAHQSILNGIHSVIKGHSTTIVSTKTVRQMVRTQPRAYIALGEDALSAVKNLGVPVIFSLVVNPRSLGIKGREITGIEPFVSIEKQLDIIQSAFPKTKTIGVIYSSMSMGYVIDSIRQTATRRGLTFIDKEAGSADEAMIIMDHIIPKIDVFWMLPDTTVVTPETVKHLFQLSLDKKIPVFSFSDKYIKKPGAVIALGIDLVMLGRQIGEITNRVLAGEPASSIPIENVKNGTLFVNSPMASLLNISIPNSIIMQAILNIHYD